MTNTFNNIQELYEDMLNHCKYFTLGISENTYSNDVAVFGEVIFSNFEFINHNYESGNNELQFWQSNRSDGANLYLHNVVGGQRTGNPMESEMFEYSFQLKNKREPFAMLAFGRRNK